MQRLCSDCARQPPFCATLAPSKPMWMGWPLSSWCASRANEEALPWCRRDRRSAGGSSRKRCWRSIFLQFPFSSQSQRHACKMRSFMQIESRWECLISILQQGETNCSLQTHGPPRASPRRAARRAEARLCRYQPAANMPTDRAASPARLVAARSLSEICQPVLHLGPAFCPLS